ncbi:MAG TPA: hypothetical protein VFC10_05905 [Terriglobia bacterium]|jgi:hypothetical protein|nr:hypothetical protein [Terriglobia bacterium]
MPSEISKTLTAYQNSLSKSRDRYKNLYLSRGQNALEFYRQYASTLVKNYSALFEDASFRRRIHRQIERLLGSGIVDFVAVDGSCNKDPFNDFIVFSACAYGAKGQLELGDADGRPMLRYRRWQLDRDVSMVAYVPVPFAQLAEATGEKEDFLLSDQDRINLSSVHTKLMQLAEVYLAYSVATSSSIERPRLILMDLLPSSVIASLAAKPADINLGGYEYDRRRLDFKDIVTALAHPVSDNLELPNHNEFRLHQLIMGELHRAGSRTIDLEDVARRHGLSPDSLLRAAKDRLFGDMKKYKEVPDGLLDLSVPGGRLLPRVRRVGVLQGSRFETRYSSGPGQDVVFDVRQSWEFSKSLFSSICDRLFRRKEPNAMIYEVVGTDGKAREHWLDPDDIDFLTSVGIRALIEACWEQKIILVGIAKDSASRYFTRNYMGVLRYGLKLPELADLDVGRLPWTDRMVFEFIANMEDNLQAPWSTVEFDSAFMTLWIAELVDNLGNSRMKLSAVMDHIIAHMGLFARSLAQFFLSRRKATTLMGHVVFVDRLLSEQLDRSCPRLDLTSKVLEANGLLSHDFGHVRPLGYTAASQENIGQDITMYLLSCLTRNHYPEVIGYPDPLHKADWGAKTLGDQLRAMIRSSEAAFRAQPLSKTLRSIRDAYRR